MEVFPLTFEPIQMKGRKKINPTISTSAIDPALDDVIAWLTGGVINLWEASQLARLTPEGLRSESINARILREELLGDYLYLKWTKKQLRARIDEILELSDLVFLESTAPRFAKTRPFDPLLELATVDPNHPLHKCMKQVSRTMRRISPDDLEHVDLDQIYEATDNLTNLLYSIKKEQEFRQQREAATDVEPISSKPAHIITIIQDPVTRKITYSFKR